MYLYLVRILHDALRGSGLLGLVGLNLRLSKQQGIVVPAPFWAVRRTGSGAARDSFWANVRGRFVQLRPEIDPYIPLLGLGEMP